MPALNDTIFSRTLDALYMAVSDESQWVTALARVSESFDSPRLAILRGAPRLDGIFEMRQLNHDPEAERLYNAYYWAFDPSHRATRDAAVGEWIDRPELFDPQTTPEPEYMDYAIRHGIRYVCGGKVHADATSVTLLGMQRPADHRPFGASTAQAFAALGLHVGRAAALSSELRRAELVKGLSLTALDALEWAVFAVDGHRTLLLANRRAETVLMGSSPVALRGRKLASRDADLDKRLADAVASAGRLRATAFSCSVGGQRWLLRVVPITPYAGAALIYMNSAETTASSVEILRTTFGFSPVEAEVAHLLAEGFSAKEIARERQVSLNTVRSQIKQIFHKAGVRRQSELAKILSAAPRLAAHV